MFWSIKDSGEVLSFGLVWFGLMLNVPVNNFSSCWGGATGGT